MPNHQQQHSQDSGLIRREGEGGFVFCFFFKGGRGGGLGTCVCSLDQLSRPIYRPGPTKAYSPIPLLSQANAVLSLSLSLSLSFFLPSSQSRAAARPVARCPRRRTAQAARRARRTDHRDLAAWSLLLHRGEEDAADEESRTRLLDPLPSAVWL